MGFPVKVAFHFFTVLQDCVLQCGPLWPETKPLPGSRSADPHRVQPEADTEN